MIKIICNKVKFIFLNINVICKKHSDLTGFQVHFCVFLLDAFRYIFRNDDNNIRQGDTYELLYHSNGRWLSAGHQIAGTTLLYYENVPTDALYWLRNHTRGKE